MSKAAELAALIANVNKGSSLANKNFIINGNFAVWQRGTSFADITSTAYTADRWTCYASSTSHTTTTRQSFSVGQTDVEGNPKYFLRLDNTPDADVAWMELWQRIEDVTHFSDVTVTLSFWIKSNRASASGNNNFRFNQNFGSGGSTTVATNSSTFEISTSWAKKTLTVNLPSISGKTVGSSSYLEVHLMQGSSVTADTYYDIAQVQLEIGKATEFEYEPYATTLAKCQRYYTRWQADSGYDGFAPGYWLVTTQFFGMYELPVQMRQEPTIAIGGSFVIHSNGSDTTVGSLIVNRATPSNVQTYSDQSSHTGTAGNAGAYRTNNDNDAYVEFKAEL